jgi:hypothetical protein
VEILWRYFCYGASRSGHHISYLWDDIQNIPDWCRRLYSSCNSAKHRWMVGLPCLVSQYAK